MTISSQGFTFDPPAGYAPEETTLVLKPSEQEGPSPTLVFHSRKVAVEATLDSLASEVVSELAAAGDKVPRLTNFTFSDGAKGMMIMHSQATPAGHVRQYLVTRLTNGTQVTLMVNVPDVPELQATAPELMQTFASLRLG